MPDISELLRHWGYLGIFVIVLLGNVGLPVPEESVLAVAGYLAHEGVLRPWLTVAVGVVSAVVGDNAGYWVGRRVGRPAIEQFGQRVGITRSRMQTITGFIERYGAAGVFAGRFIPGIRVLAGPVAGATGLAPGRFVVANFLGALCYVPFAIGIGYALAYGLGPHLRRLEHALGRVEHVAILAIVAAAMITLAWRALRKRTNQADATT
jgi:membrane protein DedA with SNARE-associated domain